MRITTTITVSDSIYTFYQMVAEEMGNVTVEEAMSRALQSYISMIAKEIIKKDLDDAQRSCMTQ